MNERIQQLALQAKLLQEQDGDVYLLEHATGELEKFAELIVQECAEIGDNYQDILEDDPECFNCRKVAYGIVDKIKKHFGVEE